MNTAVCASTGYSAAYLTFGRELRTPDEAQRDLRAIVQSENFVPEITPKRTRSRRIKGRRLQTNIADHPLLSR